MHVRLHASEWGVMRHGKIDVVVWIQTQVRVTAETVSSELGANSVYFGYLGIWLTYREVNPNTSEIGAKEVKLQ
ncbi:hypothetical protein NDU88_002566 [Pleurodeles waltl]|uniref:Uncharacterized protein n=1 Tax=Pleurodeles waltl TaxID=8319 RepID=A0AAV7WPV4_PLEWA|nr:hypothetical protein NDU88_002566 [Pleurodeles waltl]